jgi:hypothetical protein
MSAPAPDIQPPAAPEPVWDGVPDKHHTSTLDYTLETRLLDRWRHDRDVGARNKLMVAYLPMVDFAANKYHSDRLDSKDKHGLALDELIRIMEKMPDEGLGCNGSLLALHHYMRTNMSRKIGETIKSFFTAASGYAALAIPLQRFDGNYTYEETSRNEYGQRPYDLFEARHDLGRILASAQLTSIESRVVENEIAGGEPGDLVTSEGWSSQKIKSAKHRAVERMGAVRL